MEGLPLLAAIRVDRVHQTDGQDGPGWNGSFLRRRWRRRRRRWGRGHGRRLSWRRLVLLVLSLRPGGGRRNGGIVLARGGHGVPAPPGWAWLLRPYPSRRHGRL